MDFKAFYIVLSTCSNCLKPCFKIYLFCCNDGKSFMTTGSIQPNTTYKKSVKCSRNKKNILFNMQINLNEHKYCSPSQSTSNVPPLLSILLQRD